MTEEEDEVDDELAISINYSPAEIVALLQLLDYLDVFMLREGIPLGAIGMTRRKIINEIVEDDIVEVLKNEQDERYEEFKEMMTTEELQDEVERSGFQ